MGYLTKTMLIDIAHNNEKPVWLKKGVKEYLDNELMEMTINIFKLIREKHQEEKRKVATIKDIEQAIKQHYEEHVHDIASKTLDEIKENLYDTLKKQMERLDGYYGKNQTKTTETTQ